MFLGKEVKQQLANPPLHTKIRPTTKTQPQYQPMANQKEKNDNHDYGSKMLTNITLDKHNEHSY